MFELLTIIINSYSYNTYVFAWYILTNHFLASKDTKASVSIELVDNKGEEPNSIK